MLTRAYKPKVFFACLVLLFQSLCTFANSDESAQSVQLGQLQPVGSASLKVLWFNVYDARLLTSNGVFEEGKSAALELVYLRDIRKKNLLQETRKQLENKLDPDIMEQGLQQLDDIWPDIKKQDSLMFYLENANSGHFFYNSEQIGQVNVPGFAAAFLDIWVSEESKYPELAAQLTGRVFSNSAESK